MPCSGETPRPTRSVQNPCLSSISGVCVGSVSLICAETAGFLSMLGLSSPFNPPSAKVSEFGKARIRITFVTRQSKGVVCLLPWLSGILGCVHFLCSEASLHFQTSFVVHASLNLFLF